MEVPGEESSGGSMIEADDQVPKFPSHAPRKPYTETLNTSLISSGGTAGR